MLRFLKKSVIYLTCFISAFLLFIQIPVINRNLTQAVINFISPADQQVRIGRIKGAFPFDMRINYIKVKDKAGIWLDVKNAHISWRAIDLFFGQITFDKIEIDSIQQLRQPIVTPTLSSDTPPFSLKDLDLPNLAIRELALHNLHLNPYFKGTGSIKGNLQRAFLGNRSAELVISSANKDLIMLNLESSDEKLLLKVTSSNDIEDFLKIFPEASENLNGGKFKLEMNLLVDKYFNTIEGFLKGNISNFKSKSVDLQHLIGDQLIWNIPITKDENDLLIISDGLIKSGKTIDIKINASLSRDLKKADLSFHSRTNDLSPLLPASLTTIKGPLNADLTIKAKDSFSTIDMILEFRDPIFYGQPLKKAQISLNLKDYVGKLSSTIEHPLLKSSLATDVDFPDFNTLKLKNFNFKGLGGEIKGHMEIPFSNLYSMKGNMKATFDSLTSVNKILGSEASGSLKATFDIDSLDNATLQARLNKYGSQNPFLKDILIDLHTVKGNGKFSITSQDQVSDLSILGKINDNFNVVTINTLDFSYLKSSLVSLASAIIFKREGSSIVISAPQIKVGGGQVKIQDVTIGDYLKGVITLNQLSFASLEKFLPDLDLKGTLDGKIQLAGDMAEPEMRGEIAIQKLGVNDASRKTDKYSSIKLNFSKLNEEWSASLNYTDTSNSQLKGDFKVWDNTFFPGSHAHMNFNLNGRIDLSTFNGYLWWGDRIKGLVNVDCKASNTFENPVLSGTISMKEGYYENAEFGTLVTDIKTQITLNNKKISLILLEGKDYSQGTVSGTGYIDMTNLMSIKPAINLNVKQFVIANNDLTTIRCDGKIALKPDNKDHLTLEGDVTINSAEIILDETVKGAKVIKINEPISPEKQLQKLKKKKNIDSNFLLDLNVNIPNNLVVEGFGLDSLWEGKLNVHGPANNLSIKGLIETTKGKLNIIGKELILERSSVSFINEDREIVPVLRIRAGKIIRDVNAFITISGKATQPEIEFTSSPILAQEEIIALILFGKPLSSVSAAQSLQLAAAIAAVKSGNSTKGILDKLGNVFGLDDVGISSGDETNEDSTGNYGIRVGKQLNDRIYVAVDQGFKSEMGTTITMNIDVTKNTKINLEGGSRSSGVGYTWEKRY